MAKSKAKPDDDARIETVEQGDIYFVYRPKVQEAPDEGEAPEPAEGIEDVERFYMVLKPDGSDRYRMIVVGRKRMPDVAEHERNWGFVETVARSAKDIEEALRRETYETKTRGERLRPAARAAGEGVYAIVNKNKDMHLAYALELPERPGAVQKALNIAPEASFVLSVKNPDKGSPKNAGLEEEDEADYPKSLQKEFRGRRFATEDPKLLDYEGAEIVLIGARRNPEKAYGTDLEPEHESADTADVVRKLRFAKSRHPISPLLRGEWR